MAATRVAGQICRPLPTFCAPEAQHPRVHIATVAYFFFVESLNTETFGASVLNRSGLGDGGFLGCLGFFASRLLRCSPFGISLPLSAATDRTALRPILGVFLMDVAIYLP
ncbi:hypothetical protein [Paraburkholderia monticola]|uniref:hypothetical protein n=1 Tax=Paraburkholderia monticola TaxID=1399968 RepID=UPI001379AA9D|nr:hypothetical protein [Paraburkholderia monticola]